MMKQTNKFIGAALVGALALGASTQASAVVAPTFTYDLDGVAGGATVTANSASGVSSEYLVVTGADTFSGAGYVAYSSLNLNSFPQFNSSYFDTGLYAWFTLAVKLTSGSFGQAGSDYDVTGFHFDLYKDAGFDNVFTQADAGSSTAASIANTVGDILLGSGDLIFGNSGLESTDAASLNVKTDFALTLAGGDYFIDPAPFYDLALSGFNSTGGNWEFNPLATGGAALSIGNSTGITDFARVPEPASLALLGLGLVGMGVARKRKA